MIAVPEPVMDAIRAHAAACAPREACGLLVAEADDTLRFEPCANLAREAEQFVLAPEDYARCEDAGTVRAVVHSHVHLPPEPSMADRAGCERSGLPWLIVTHPTGAHAWLAPAGYQAPYVGREFAHGVLDCYTIVRDWFARERNLVLTDYPRAVEWWHAGEDLYRAHFAAEGFERVDGPAEPGDVFLMQIRSPVPNHAAVYVGDGLILHHLQGRLSCRDVYGGYWRRVTVMHLRNAWVAAPGDL